MEKRIEDWKDLRFGMFIHWGLYALLGRGEWALFHEALDADEYSKLTESFTAEHFDARAWAETAKAAGMKYMVLTTRHHDGFSLWDSPGSVGHYDAMHCAAHRDFVREFTDACREAGLKVGLYYSPLDWRLPGFFFPRMYKKSAEELRKQTHDQLRELLTNYGKIDILWFDGGEDYWLCHGRDLHAWHEEGTIRDHVQIPNFWHSDELVSMIRSLQPDIVMNNRLAMRQYGDFLTPEGEIGAYNTKENWETNYTLNGSWGYVPNPPRSFRECVNLLVRCATGDGNFLLNVGPRADGTMPEEHVARLQEVGAFLQRYGESIYGTRGGPFINDKTGGMTWHGNTLYVHVLDWPSDEIRLPKLDAKVLKAECLTADTLSLKEQDGHVCFSVSPQDRLAVDTIVKLELDRNVGELAADIPWRMNAERDDFAHALIVDKL